MALGLGHGVVAKPVKEDVGIVSGEAEERFISRCRRIGADAREGVVFDRASLHTRADDVGDAGEVDDDAISAQRAVLIVGELPGAAGEWLERVVAGTEGQADRQRFGQIDQGEIDLVVTAKGRDVDGAGEARIERRDRQCVVAGAEVDLQGSSRIREVGGLDVTGDTAHLDAARSGVVLDDPIVAVDVTLEDDRR